MLIKTITQNYSMADQYLTLSHAIAKTILNGFERHIFLFGELTRSAKSRFELCQWKQVHEASKKRTDFFDKRVSETLKTIQQDFNITILDKALWKEIKIRYITCLQQHPQAELAESFFNSVFCHLFERKYYQNQYIFVESQSAMLPTEYADKIYTRYDPSEKGLKSTIEHIINQAQFSSKFTALQKEIHLLLNAFLKKPELAKCALSDISFDILNFTFFRNKGAYVIGRVHYPNGEIPFIVPITNHEKKGLHIDALLTEPENMAVVFGFARSYFFVDCAYPQALVNFLQTLIPHKTRADLYSAIGFHKQGKTQFYRDFLHHLSYSEDEFTLAEGVKGMVMSVFTLPSYPYVFKIIKDKFAPSKQMTKQTVKNKYRLVKLHDRVGRMADTMEYSEVAFPKHRFSQSLIEELLTVAPSIVSFEDENIIIQHVYIERRMTPLNIYLSKASDDEIDEAMFGYGEAIKQLIAANIFPGDMLLKNFGVTRHGRVIFYDYDEITYMNDVNFRVKPEPVTEEQIFAAEPWYSVEPGDMFPEELATFALANQQYRAAFLKHHSELLQASYWQSKQKNITAGIYEDVFPYPAHLKLSPP